MPGSELVTEIKRIRQYPWLGGVNSLKRKQRVYFNSVVNYRATRMHYSYVEQYRRISLPGTQERRVWRAHMCASTNHVQNQVQLIYGIWSSGWRLFLRLPGEAASGRRGDRSADTAAVPFLGVSVSYSDLFSLKRYQAFYLQFINFLPWYTNLGYFQPIKY